MLEYRQCLEEDPALAKKYQALLQIGGPGGESHVEVTLRAIIWNDSLIGPNPTGTSVSQVIKVSVEGGKVIVKSVSLRAGAPDRHIGYVLRMNKQWLVISERYYGSQACLFPRSPVFRYSPRSDTLLLPKIHVLGQHRLFCLNILFCFGEPPQTSHDSSRFGG